jgi:GNAT superfamily N-acetyltransferase
MLTIRPLEFDRIVPVAANLCAADMAELDAAGIEDAKAMLLDAVPHCCWAKEARWNDQSVAIFGVRPLEGRDVGVPWMLTTKHMEAAERAAVAMAAMRAVRQMRIEFPRLMNLVHAQNARAIRFIQALGFTVDDAPLGRGGAFRRFHWERRDV